VWQDTSESDGCANQSVEFFVTTDSQLEMTRSDTLDFEILGGILLVLLDKPRKDKMAKRYE
jgi:hypothetical protein